MLLKQRVLWTDENGYPYTRFRDRITFFRYRNHQENFSDLDDWYYIEESSWIEKFSTSPAHMSVYDYVSKDHLDDLESCRLNVFSDEGNLIKSFSVFEEVRQYFLDELDSYFYWGWLDSYNLLPYRAVRKVREDSYYGAKFHETRVGKIFVSTHPLLTPKMPVSIHFDEAPKRNYFYLPAPLYFERHENLLATKVYVN